MPTLKDIPDLFAGYDPESPYVSLPVISSKAVFSQLQESGAKSAAMAFALQNYQSFSSITRSTVAGQAQRLGGVPEWLTTPVHTMFERIPTVVDGSMLIDVGKQVWKQTVAALDNISESVDESISMAASAVPIVGAIVNLGIGLYRMISEGLAAGQDDIGPRPAFKFAPMTYDYAEDLGNGMTLSTIARSDDWTELFLPPSADPTFHVGLLASPLGGAKWWTPNQLGAGLVPGLASQVGEYQMFNTNAALSTGNYYPSSRKFATVLWQMAMKPSVQMFNIDSVAIESAWVGYYHALWKLADFDGDFLGLNSYNIMWLRARIRQTASYSRMYDCEAATKWKSGSIGNCQWDPKAGKVDPDLLNPPVFRPQSVLDSFPREKLSKRVKLTGLYSDVVSYVCQIHRERAAACLGTLVVAYVPSDAPLLRGDPALKQLHTEMRTALLSHKARYQVELDLIPDGTEEDRAYRSALDATTIPGVEHLADVGLAVGSSSGKKPKPGNPPRLPLPGKDRAPNPPDAPPPGLPEDAGVPKAVDGGAGWVLALAAGVVVAGGIAVVAHKSKR